MRNESRTAESFYFTPALIAFHAKLIISTRGPDVFEQLQILNASNSQPI